jgi:hypothetical protein
MALKTTERLTLMKEIAARLSGENGRWWTQRLLHSPCQRRMTGAAAARSVLAMIGKASDKILIELAEHVGFRFEVKTAIRVDPPYYRKHMLRVFIGHRAERGA